MNLLHRWNWKHGPIIKYGYLVVQCKKCKKIADFDLDPWSMGAYNWRPLVTKGEWIDQPHE